MSTLRTVDKTQIDDKDDLVKQAYELVKGVELSLLLMGNLPEILTGEQIILLEKRRIGDGNRN